VTRTNQGRRSEDEAFSTELLAAGTLVETGVAGVYGRSGEFEAVVSGFDALVTRETQRDAAEVLRFPPVLPRRHLDTSGYMSSFPHLAGSVFSFAGDDEAAAELGARSARHDDWSDLQEMTDIVLVPAACYPVYPSVARQGRLPVEGRLIDICCYCFRNEPSHDLARMQSFRQREHVRVGRAEDVRSWHGAWIERGGDILASVGLETAVVPASDAFFGRRGRMLAADQLDRGLKLERVGVVTSHEPTAIMSINHHEDHFGRDFGIELEDGTAAHSACFGFGLERVALALYRAHGVDVATWPHEARSRLGLDGV
jgi:seryl-tRNA synthetase